MRTVVETPTFQRQASEIWSEDERLDFITWISKNPLAGDVIPGAEGARKIRWSLESRGKRGGVRVIYFNLSAQGVVYLVAIYKKSERENISAHNLKKEL
jgi:hypothetical protein